MSLGYVIYVCKLLVCKIIVKCRTSGGASDTGTNLSSEHDLWNASIAPASAASSDVALVPVEQGSADL